MWATYELEAAADGGLNVGAAKGGDLAELTGDLDGVVEQEAQTALVTEARGAGNLPKQDWEAEHGGSQEGMKGVSGDIEQRLRIQKKKSLNLNFVHCSFEHLKEPGVGLAS